MNENGCPDCDHTDRVMLSLKAKLSTAERERDEARRELEKTRSALIAMIRVVEKCQTIFNEKTIRSTISVGVSTGWIWDEEMHVARQLIANYESPKPAKELGAAHTSDDATVAKIRGEING